jgi:glycopeptide antibiotics resistance protein
MLAQYLFREGSGSLIHSAVSAAVDLYIPERFTVVDQLHFESPISEAHTDRSYRANAILNIVGFVPLGFAAALFLASIWKIKRLAIVATLIGTSTSLAIECFQAYLPTRYSGMTDLVTNTIGCWIGAVLYCSIAGFLARKLARKPAE